MADKKFKTGVDIQSTVKISSETSERALILDASGNVVSSSVTSVELAHVSGVTSPLQTQLAAKADLVGGKIPSSQIPAIAITEVFAAADITARNAITIGTSDGEVQEGDVVVVVDASSDAAITAGAASYIYDGSAYVLLKAGDEVLSVNGETGVVTLDADNISDAVTVNKFATAAQLAKVDFLTVTQEVDLDTLESDTTANNAKVSADGSVVTHSDVTNAGSGAIITVLERADIVANTAAKHDALTLNAGDSSQDSASLSGQELTINAATTSTDGVMSSEDKTKIDSIEASATADQTGAEIKAAYEAEADTNAYNDAAVSKLGGIEALADVTDATNVNAAGAVMESDATTVGMSFVIDEDSMVSDSATKVPTQQSVKAYIDNNAGNTSAGDITETSATLSDNQAAAANITGLAFANATVRSFGVHASIVRNTEYEAFQLTGIQKGASWDMSVESVGDDVGVTFSIDAAGQLQYVSTSTGNTATIKFRADTTSL